MILCAVPLGYCLVHAGLYDPETASALARDLEGEVVGNQEMVSPELDQASDVSSDVDSSRDVSSRSRLRSQRTICIDFTVFAGRSR